jgi:DNA polymerase-3 subunit alpha
LGIIKDLGFSNYFLVVWDFAMYARKHDIAYNARGSVCGSLIAYLLGITWIDPLRFDLPFERFLTADRISMPDIDMDFSSTRRQEMIDYAEARYGKECVVHICNYLKWKPKQAFKDVGRVLGYDFQTLNNITAKVEDNIKEWDDFTKISAVSKFLGDNEDLEPLAEGLIGVIRQQGIHASGVVVTPGPCMEWLPVAYRTDKTKDQKRLKVVTEWDMYALEDLDILKLDFLGVNQLDIVALAIDLIKKRHKVPFNNLDDLYANLLANNCSDPEVYKLIARENTVGTFQLGTSDGMRTLGKELKPDCIDEIIAMISLYRTAVLEEGMHTQYVKRKYGESFKYIHPKMKSVLKDTHGVMLYQEQMMAMGVVLAGFTRNDADHFRKGIKLKDLKKVRAWKSKFVKGCKEYSGIKKQSALKIWDFMEAFAGYGFNKSHAASYGVLAYLTAWLKVHYRTEYMAALLSCNTTDDKKLYKYILDTKKSGTKILSPSVNNSQENFTITRRGIMYPLQAVKQVGDKAVQAILLERVEHGRYRSFEDFHDRVNKRVVNVGVMVNLILADAFRKFGSKEQVFDDLMDMRTDKTVRQLYCYECRHRYPCSKTEKAIENEGLVCPNCGDTEIDAFPNSRLPKKLRKKKFDKDYIAKHVFGFFIQECQLNQYIDVIAKERCHSLETVEVIPEDNMIKVAFEVRKLKQILDRSGNKMAFADITDGSYESSIVFFARDWEGLNMVIKEGGCYIGNLFKNRGKFLFSGYKGSYIRRLKKTYKGK